MATAVLGGAIQLSLDGDGRINLPENLIKKAGLNDKAIFIGKGPTFEIWQPSKFAKYAEKARADAKGSLAHLKLAGK